MTWESSVYHGTGCWKSQALKQGSPAGKSNLRNGLPEWKLPRPTQVNQYHQLFMKYLTRLGTKDTSHKESLWPKLANMAAENPDLAVSPTWTVPHSRTPATAPLPACLLGDWAKLLCLSLFPPAVAPWLRVGLHRPKSPLLKISEFEMQVEYPFCEMAAWDFSSSGNTYIRIMRYPEDRIHLSQTWSLFIFHIHFTHTA